MHLNFKKEYFPQDSLFLELDERKDRRHMPTEYNATNIRANWFFNENKDIVKDKNILDLGCFSGLFSYCCLQLGAKSVHGIDLTEKQIHRAQEIFSGFPEFEGKYSFESGDLLEIIKKIPDNAYDTSLMIGILYFFPDYFEVLREVSRVTKGAVIIDTMSPAYIPILFQKYSYSNYFDFLNESLVYYRNRDEEDFTKRGFEVKKFGGERSMTYMSHNYLRMALKNVGFQKTAFLEFDDQCNGVYKEYSQNDTFEVLPSSKLEALFKKIVSDYNGSIYPYFLNARYIAVAKK